MTDPDPDFILAALITVIEDCLDLLTPIRRATVIVRLCGWLGSYDVRSVEAQKEPTA